MASKEEKEAFVTGHNGSSLLPIVGFSLILACTNITYAALHSFLALSTRKHLNGETMSFSRIVIEFVCLVMPVLMASICVLRQSTILIGQIVVTLVLACGAYIISGEWPVNLAMFAPYSTRFGTPSKAQLISLNSPRKYFLAAPRTALMIGTCIAILAVDFPAFPRYFAKTENYGTSLMDTGVGSFVFMNGVVSLHRKKSMATQKLSCFNNLKAILLQATPLFIIGSLRLLTNKAADYQEHVSEYGTHWNFFYSLTALTVSTGLICPYLLPKWRIYSGIFIGVAYQTVLCKGGLSEYVLNCERTNLFHANKEGIVSTIGNLSLYLLSMGLGDYLLENYKPRKKSAANFRWRDACAEIQRETKETENMQIGMFWRRKFFTLLAMDVIMWILTMFSQTYVQEASRRMVNLTYIFWSLAHNLVQIIVALGVQMVFTTEIDKTSIIDRSVGRNTLFFFMLCNIFTGITNLSIDTMNQTQNVAFSVLFVYMFAALSAVILLDKQKITLKYW